MDINWEAVSNKLKCPLCGEKAYIDSGTDGTRGMHIHRFEITREHAMELTVQAAKEELEALKKRVAELESL